MKFWVVVAVLLNGAGAMACELSLVAPVTSALKNPVEAHVSLADDALIARFSVSTPSLNAKKVFAQGEYPYQYDVVELFVTFSDSGFPYYEFEVSPYNQTFQVRILSAKQHQEGVYLGLTSTATMAAGGWNAELKSRLNPSVGMAIQRKFAAISIRPWGRAHAATGVRFCRRPKSRIFTSRNIFNHCCRVARRIFVKRPVSAFGCEAEAGFQDRWVSQ
jgi:hypothetical protein